MDARLTVLSPKSLADGFRGKFSRQANPTFDLDNKINANYANFGFIPYGQTIMGKIHVDLDDLNACNEFPD